MQRLFLIWMLCLWPVASSADDYTPSFQRYTERYWQDVPGVRWPLIESVAWAESSFRADAQSSVGAKGLLQVMDETFADIQRAVPSLQFGDIFDPETSIHAGTWYLRRHCWDYWTVPRSEREQLKVALGSYNAGAGNIDKAWGLARSRGMEGSWDDVAFCLPDITGPANAKQTTDYVPKILSRYDRRLSELPPETVEEEARRELAEVVSDIVQTVAEVVPPAVAEASNLEQTEGTMTEATLAALSIDSLTELLAHQGGSKVGLLIIAILAGIFVPPYAFKRWDQTLSYDTAEEIANGKPFVFGMAVIQTIGIFGIIITALILLH